MVGYLASFAGAGIIGLAAAVFATGLQAGVVVLVIILGGLVGATIDSLLGATVQGIYHCPTCDKETERYPEHHCGTETIQLRGWHWLNNDIVNLICSLVGAVTALVVWLLIH